METKTTPTGVRHERTHGPIMLDKISKSDYQKEGTLTAQIRQIITTKSFYPSKKVQTTMQANVFSAEDFGFAPQQFESSEVRVAWIPVPVNASSESVKQKLEAAYNNGACIYRVLSNAPILDESQVYAIAQGLTTKDVFANAQAVRYPENEETLRDGTANKLTLDKEGRVQYRRTFFWLTKMEDVDVRGQEQYLSPELKAELAGASVMLGQTI